MTFYMPVKVYSGIGCIEKNASVFSKFGKTALIVTGKTSAKSSGALDDVISVLKNQNISYHIFDKVLNNPTVENCFDGGQFAKEVNADFIIAIGGGSPLDAAKAIATYAKNDIEPFEIFSGNIKNKALPFIAIPTTAGTGSEVTPYSILTVDAKETKINFSSSDTFARVAFLDARYTESLPLHVTVDTAIDALSHAFESILNKRSNEMSELYAKETIKLIGKAMPALLSGKLDITERELLLKAAMYGGIAISQTGTCFVHSMGYPLTYYKGLSHGRANGMILGSFVEGNEKVCPELVKELLGYLNLKNASDFSVLLKKLMPDSHILTEDEAKTFAHKAIQAKNVSLCLWNLTEKEEYEMFSKLI